MQIFRIFAESDRFVSHRVRKTAILRGDGLFFVYLQKLQRDGKDLHITTNPGKGQEDRADCRSVSYLRERLLALCAART